MTIRYYGVLLAFALLCSCSKEPLPDRIERYESRKIVFNDLAIGQSNRYQLFDGEDYADTDNDRFSYLGDTLIVEIVAEDELGFYLKEALTPGSRSLHDAFNVRHAERTIYYHVRFEQDHFRVLPDDERYQSRLFFLENSLGLPRHRIEGTELEMFGWKTNMPHHANYVEASILDIDFQEFHFPHLNVLIDNTHLDIGSGYGHMHWYDADHGGLVRSAVYSGQTARGFGWDLVD